MESEYLTILLDCLVIIAFVLGYLVYYKQLKKCKTLESTLGWYVVEHSDLKEKCVKQHAEISKLKLRLQSYKGK